MKAEKIVTAVDLGEDTESVISYAAWLARSVGQGASITLLHVMDYALTPPTYLAPYIEDEKKKNTAVLDQWSARLRDEQHIVAGTEVMMGRLIEAVGSYIREKSPDVLVIGHKHHIIRSSSAGRLIRSLRQPMLVVRGDRSGSAVLGGVEVKRILCPVDFSENSQKALQWAAFLAKRENADLTVLHVQPGYTLPAGMEGRKIAKEIQRYHAEALADTDAYLVNLTDSIDPGRRPSVVTRSGSPFSAINELSSGMDMVVIGARGKTFFEGLVLGSVSESVVRSSPCPVFVVH